MKKKALALTLAALMALSLTACGNKQAEDVDEQTDEMQDTQPVEEGQEEPGTEQETGTPEAEGTAVDTVVVAPMLVDVDMNNLGDRTFAMEADPATAYNAQANTLTVNLYQNEVFDAVELSRLKEGDTLSVGGEVFTVKTVTTSEGYIVVNDGDMTNGGLLFRSNDGNTYIAVGMDDQPVFTSVGEYTFVVPAGLTYTDASDLDASPVTYSGKDLVRAIQGGQQVFSRYNTTIQFKGGVPAAVVLDFMP